MRLNILNLLLLFVLCTQAHSQTMQIKFCGKTTNVSPATDGNGADQRHKGALRLDYIRVGRIGQSSTSPFYALGTSTGLAFKNYTWVDGCTNNSNQTYCSGCTRCTPVTDNSNKQLGVFEGKMTGNVRMRSTNNDLYLESTGDQNLVCFVTDPFDVSAHVGKKIEVNIGYEGTTQDGFSTKNVNFLYKYSNGDWTQLLNQNSNFLRIIDTTIFVIRSVDVSTLDDLVQFTVNPNPVKDELQISMQSKVYSNLRASVIDIQSKQVQSENFTVAEGSSQHTMMVDKLAPGAYLLQLSDEKGRISSMKFVKK